MRTIPCAVAALTLALAVLAGCGVKIDKSLTIHADEARFPEVAGAGGAANSDQQPDDATSTASAGRSDATRQTGPINVHARWESSTDAETAVEQIMRAAASIPVAAGGGSASGGDPDASGDDGEGQ